ncbi:MAG: hypothetical protein PHI51_02595 [Candidatus Peribacteraceae bacterium]|nr:hypothetical protein [Candidatus Peribacteraceae bacterium]
MEHPLQPLNDLRVGFIAYRAFEECQNRAVMEASGGIGVGVT